jgi:hypothetical protein
VIRRAAFLAILALSQQAAADEASVATLYTAWLKATHLDKVLSVESYDANQRRLTLKAGDSFESLRELATARKAPLDQRLFIKFVHLTQQPVAGAQLRIQGPLPCLRVVVSGGAKGTSTSEERLCRSGGQATLPAAIVAAIAKSAPALGSQSVGQVTSVKDRVLRELQHHFDGKGALRVISDDDNYLQLEVMKMRGEIMPGDRWWETLQLSLWIEPKSSDSNPADGGATLRWQATGRFGAGLLRAPSTLEGYGADFEPAHAEELASYVKSLLVKVKQSMATP